MERRMLTFRLLGGRDVWIQRFNRYLPWLAWRTRTWLEAADQQDTGFHPAGIPPSVPLPPPQPHAPFKLSRPLPNTAASLSESWPNYPGVSPHGPVVLAREIGTMLAKCWASASGAEPTFHLLCTSALFERVWPWTVKPWQFAAVCIVYRKFLELWYLLCSVGM